MTDTSTESAPAENGEQPHGSNSSNEQGGTENTPTIEELTAKVEELTQHSRKWEQRAKDNKAAADRLAEMEKANMSEAEKAERARTEAAQRAEEAEARAVEAEKTVLRYKIAADFSMSAEDAELILTGADEDTMRKQAQRFSERVPAGPNPPRSHPQQGQRSGSGPSTPEDRFGDFLDQYL